VADSGTSRRLGGRAILVVILLLALALRVGWAATRPTSDKTLEGLPDQLEYLGLARNLVAGRGYWFIDQRLADRVYAFRTPGFPLFLAAWGANVRVALIVQSVLAASTVLAVYLLALLLFPDTPDPRIDRRKSRRRVALFAAALVAFNPFLVYFCGLLLSETVFSAMLMWAMVLLLAGRGAAGERRPGYPWLLGGFLLALSILVRPSAIGLPLLLGIAAAFVNRKRAGAYHEGHPQSERGWPMPLGTTLLLLTLLVLFPWAIRNRSTLHHWVWIDTNGGFTLYDGYNPDATGASDQKFVQYMPQLRTMNEVQRSQYLQNRALEFIRKNPRQALELAGAKFVRTWSPVPLSEQYSQQKYQIIGLCFALPLDVLVLWGLAAGNLTRSAKVFLLLPAIYLSVVHMMTVGSLRYRLPAEPALAILAASVLGTAVRERQKTSEGAIS